MRLLKKVASDEAGFEQKTHD